MLENLILAQTADIIHDPVIASDEQGRIVFTNAAHGRLTGWHFDEIKGRNRKLIYEIPDCDFATLQEGVTQNGILYRKDGTKITLSASCSSLRHPSVPTLSLGQITVFHPTLLNSESPRTSDDFVSTVSHELRTPLTSIRGFAETLLHSSDKLSPENRKRFLQIIKDQADHLTRLVEDLLFVSRLDNHKIHLIVRELELKKHVDKVCESLSNQAGGRLFIYDFPVNLPHILADSDRLEQILSNLLSNAIKYSPDNTSIAVRAQIFEKNASQIKISIIDRGAGIPEADQELIFNRFSRLDNPLTRKTKGTGLGLYITKSLVSALDGEIWLEKSVPQETIFSFTVPIAKNLSVAQKNEVKLPAQERQL
jgi:PAS domain S-box-containing protein